MLNLIPHVHIPLRSYSFTKTFHPIHKPSKPKLNNLLRTSPGDKNRNRSNKTKEKKISNNLINRTRDHKRMCRVPNACAVTRFCQKLVTAASLQNPIHSSYFVYFLILFSTTRFVQSKRPRESLSLSLFFFIPLSPHILRVGEVDEFENSCNIVWASQIK